MLNEFQERVRKGLEICFLHCCIGKTEKFVGLVNEHIHFQQATVTERTNDHMIINLDFGSFVLSYKLHLKDATCNEEIYNKKIVAIEAIETGSKLVS